jgi:putative copper export protein
MRRILSVVATAILLSGCYHATIETGVTPSTQTVEKHWASSWIGGLVPPSTIQTQQKCPRGVAKVETQLSFLNMLVSFLTLSIYTPMDIVATCAQ